MGLVEYRTNSFSDGEASDGIRRRRENSDLTDYEYWLLDRVGRLSEYEWQVHSGVHHHRALPDAPPGETRPVDGNARVVVANTGIVS